MVEPHLQVDDVSETGGGAHSDAAEAIQLLVFPEVALHGEELVNLVHLLHLLKRGGIWE